MVVTNTLVDPAVLEDVIAATTILSVADSSDATASTLPPGSMLDVVKEHLDAETWSYKTDVQEARTVLSAGAKGINGSYAVAFDIWEAKNALYIYVRSHINFPAENRPALAIYTARANYGLALGNFEIDMDDGEVRYKCTTTVSGGALTVGMVGTMLQNSLTTMDRYFGNMVKVGYGIMSPEDAIKDVEAPRITTESTSSGTRVSVNQ